MLPVRWFVVAVVAFGALALAAAVDGGSLLLHVDEPIERFALDHRTAGLDRTFTTLTRLGDSGVAIGCGIALAALAAVWDRSLALFVLIAVLVRPVVTNGIKGLVDRPRPLLGPLTDAYNSSFPSGHTMGVATVWLALPAVAVAAGAGTRGRRIAWVMAVLVVLAVAVSRVYLGVHWATDVLGGALGGAVLLTAVALVAARVDQAEIRSARDSGGASRPPS